LETDEVTRIDGYFRRRTQTSKSQKSGKSNVEGTCDPEKQCCGSRRVKMTKKVEKSK
jgi:hypothetical protein